MRIQILFKKGHRIVLTPLRVYYCLYPVPEACHQVLFRVPKKLHALSTTRHLLTRRMREAYRHHKHHIASITATKHFLLLAYIYNEACIYPYTTLEQQLITSLIHIKHTLT